MRILTAIFIGALILAGCASFSQRKESSIYSTVDSISLQSSKVDVIAKLGLPSQCDKLNQDEKCIYNMPYKNKMLPLIEITFDSSGHLIDKYMILDPSSLQLSLEQLQKRYPEAQLVKGETTYATSKHSYSTEYFVEDKAKGLRVKYRPNLKNEVQSIHWYSAAERSSASQR